MQEAYSPPGCLSGTRQQGLYAEELKCDRMLWLFQEIVVGESIVRY